MRPTRLGTSRGFVRVCVQLVRSKARVVTVASIKHRTVKIKDARAFLTDWRAG